MIVSPRTRRLRTAGLAALRILALAAAYYLAARAGLLLELVRGQVTPLWPPTGIALVGLLVLGLRAWPGITLGALLVNAPLGPSLPAVAMIAVGNTLAPVCGYLLLRRIGFRDQLDRLKDVLTLVFLGALISTLISAGMGAGALVLAGAVPSDAFWPTGSVWWTGDAMGVLVVAPVLLVARSWRWPRRVRPHRWIEAAALLVSTAAVTALVAGSTFLLLFLVFPFLVWAALRFHEQGAAVCTLIVSVITIHAAVVGAGTFGQHDLLSNMVTLQAFNGSAALTALLLAAVIHERDQAHRDLERAAAQLTEVVTQLSRRASARRGLVLGVVRPPGSPDRDQPLPT
jgi:integral membrane sensor domain MASE1